MEDDNVAQIQVLIADIMLRVSVLEEIILNNKLIDGEEYVKKLNEMASKVTKVLQDKHLDS